jgi:hypothetical protein
MNPKWVGNVRLTDGTEGTCERTRFGAVTHAFAEAPSKETRVQCECGGAQLRFDERGCILYHSIEDVVME